MTRILWEDSTYVSALRGLADELLAFERQRQTLPSELAKEG